MRRATEHVARTTPELNEERLSALHELLPEVFTEGKLDPEKLQAVLGTHAATGPERYTFTWAGKRDAISALQTPSDATLIPDKKHSITFDATRHLFIEGDNLEVLKLLYKPYFGRVKMIYIDPPYNTGTDRIYPDDYKHPIDSYLRLTGQTKSDGSSSTSNPETSGRYHSAWLSMMYPRLFLARQLLTENGVIFVSIDDTEESHLRLLMNEIFGEENFIATIVWRRKRGRDNSARFFSKAHEYLLVYGRSRDRCQILPLEMDDNTRKAYRNSDNDPRGPYRLLGVWARGTQGGSRFAYDSVSGQHFAERNWLVNRATLRGLDEDRRLIFVKDNIYRKLYLSEHDGNIPETIWDDVSNVANASDEIKSLFGSIVFDTPKPTPYIKRILAVATEKNDLVLDFFAGSCTTAQAVLELNREDGGRRRFIMVQLPEPLEEPKKLKDGTALNTIADIGRERIARVIAAMKDDKQTKLGEQQTEDLGFRVFRLTASHYKTFDESPESSAERFAQRLAEVVDPLRPGWKPEPVIYEVAIKEGFSLSLSVERLDMKPEVYRATDPETQQSFLVCLDERVSLNALKPLHLARDDLFICRDVALDDTTAANLALQCRLRTI